ncbi:MAG TPA: glycosyltransferase family 9 protein [Dehalococcoidia bacterium]|nr:glycosyltransferase family 9 protein [Dehalococcoidia bacterium]
MRSLKLAYPGLRLSLIGLASARELALRFLDYFDGFIEVPPLAGLHPSPADEAEVGAALQAVREQHFDVIVQMHGSGPRSNEITARMGGRLIAGFYPAGATPPEGGAFFPYPQRGSEVERNLALALALGGANAGIELEFPVTEADRIELRGVLLNEGVEPGLYVCVHPGAKLASRRWPAERFAAVADELARRGYRVLITGSSGEAALTASVRSAMRRQAVDLAGRTSLGALAALIEGSQLLVSNDTGVAHIAAALKTPSVIVANGSDVERWSSADEELHPTLAQDIDCRPCVHDVCPIGQPCALAITPAMLLERAEPLLSMSKGRPT